MFSYENQFSKYVEQVLIDDGHEIISINKPDKYNFRPDIISKHKDILHISEVKFCLTKVELYSAIGQLLIYSLGYPEQPIHLNIIAPRDNNTNAIIPEIRAELTKRYNIYIWTI